MRRTAALIIGGGPAGAAAAIALARLGERPLLIERSREAHDLVCGGFLGWDALASLDRLGIKATALGARPIMRLRLFAGSRSHELGLPHPAAGLSRRALDAALIDRAAANGAVIERGVAVRSIEGLSARLSDGGMIDGDALFLATGKHDVRGAAREAGGGAVGLRRALVATPALAAALDGVIELHCLDRGYAGLLMQEDGSANLCVSVARDRAGDPEALLAELAREAPMLGERIASASALGPVSAIAGVPYGWRADAGQAGLFRLGDQGAVIGSVVGDGIAIALASAAMATAAWRQGGAGAAPDFQRRFARAAARPIRVAEMVRQTAERPRLAGPLATIVAAIPGAAGLLARATRIGTR